MHPARARRLGPADQPKVRQHFARDLGDLAYLRPLDPWHRIEIDAQLVGVIEVLGAHRMRMQLETGEVGKPSERRGILGDDFIGRAT